MPKVIGEFKSSIKLKEVFIQLLKEKGIENISVSFLCEAAEVNRSTFYKSFSSVSDLFAKVQRDFVDGMRPYLISFRESFNLNEEEKLEKTLTLIEYFKENRDLIVLFMVNDIDNLLSTNVCDYIKGIVAPVRSEEEDLLLSHNLIGALTSIVLWIMRDMPIDEKKLAYICTPALNSKLVIK